MRDLKKYRFEEKDNKRYHRIIQTNRKVSNHLLANKPESVLWAAVKGFGRGAATGGKATANGLTKAVKSAATLGMYNNYNGVFNYTEQDIADGALASEAIANASGTVLIGVATGSAGCVAGRVGQVAKAYDMASNVVGAAQGINDIAQNGANVGNMLQTAGSVAGLSAGAASKCFTEGTQVVVGAVYDENDVFVRYVTTNIEDVKVGDFVFSYDTVTGEVSQKEVTDIFVRESDHLNYLTIADENGNVQVIETTDGHPFWVVTDEPDWSRQANETVLENGAWIYHENIAPGSGGYWVEAKDLRNGDVFLGANGELSTLVSTERVQFDESVRVYNFSVEGNHDYFVIAQTDEFGQTCILVHNGNELYRNVKGNESLNRLKNKAAEAKDKIGIHGVSVSETKPLPGTDFRTASRPEVEKHFPVHDTPTRSDANHKTIELPEPVTPSTVKVFNGLFGG